MTNQVVKFWEGFKEKNFEGAQKQLDALSDEDKQAVLSELYQKSEFHKRPIMVSVLRRVLHEGQSFDDFYQSWFPPKETINLTETAGSVYQQHFPVPVRVINGVNTNDSKEIISVGITWVRSEEEEKGLWEYLDQATKGEDEKDNKRRESIAKVADGELLGLFRVESDDNLGTPF